MTPAGPSRGRDDGDEGRLADTEQLVDVTSPESPVALTIQSPPFQPRSFSSNDFESLEDSDSSFYDLYDDLSGAVAGHVGEASFADSAEWNESHLDPLSPATSTASPPYNHHTEEALDYLVPDDDDISPHETTRLRKNQRSSTRQEVQVKSTGRSDSDRTQPAESDQVPAQTPVTALAVPLRRRPNDTLPTGLPTPSMLARQAAAASPGKAWPIVRTVRTPQDTLPIWQSKPDPTPRKKPNTARPQTNVTPETEPLPDIQVQQTQRLARWKSVVSRREERRALAKIIALAKPAAGSSWARRRRDVSGSPSAEHDNSPAEDSDNAIALK